MNHKGTIPLETEKLLLRRFEMSDARDAYRNWLSDPDVAMFMRWNAHTSEEQSEEFIRKIVSDYQKPDFYRWAVTLKPGGEAVGAIGLHVEDEFDNVADVSFALGKAYWGRGIIPEALREVLRFGLLDVGLNRIEAFHALRNPASGTVIRKAGMRYEGRLRQKYRSHAGFEDCDLYAVLREDLPTPEAVQTNII